MELGPGSLVLVGVVFILGGMIARRAGGIGPRLEGRPVVEFPPSVAGFNAWLVRNFYPGGATEHYEYVRRTGPARVIVMGIVIVVIGLYAWFSP